MNSNYLIMGAGRSGIAAAKLLLHQGAQVELFDDQKEALLSYFKKSGLAGHPRLRTYFGQELSINLANLASYEALIVSPGISFEHELIKKAQNLGVTITSEIDCAFDFLPELKIIGVTGTNGKSTTTTMIAHILAQGARAYACGNIGIPLCEMALRALNETIDYLVVELSSFQLENIKKLKLDAAVILNITPDHLDRYENINQYQQAKLKILERLKPIIKSTAIVNQNLSSLITPNNSMIRFFNEKDTSVLDKLALRGAHNQENALAAYLVSKSLGISEEQIFSALASYTPLPHRCELVATKNNISYINDSKGTTVVAVTKALSMTHGPVHLLLGGQAKGEDFSALRPEYFPHIAGYYIFGQAQQEISEALKSSRVLSYKNLEQAFRSAQQSAKAGDTILLSPACASYDQFRDYTERGELFKSLVEST